MNLHVPQKQELHRPAEKQERFSIVCFVRWI